MKINAEKVHQIMLDSLFKDEEVKDGKPPDNAIIVEGVRGKVGFHKQRLESHKSEVEEMLLDLPDNFHQSKGGGWTFLNGCMDRDGNQWGEQMNVDELVMLGSGLGIAKYLMDREMWSVLPGGLPYFAVTVGQCGLVSTRRNRAREEGEGSCQRSRSQVAPC